MVTMVRSLLLKMYPAVYDLGHENWSYGNKFVILLKYIFIEDYHAFSLCYTLVILLCLFHVNDFILSWSKVRLVLINLCDI